MFTYHGTYTRTHAHKYTHNLDRVSTNMKFLFLHDLHLNTHIRTHTHTQTHAHTYTQTYTRTHTHTQP